MSHHNRGFVTGERRGQTQRIASGARTAPYTRPEASSRSVSNSDKQWPPTQLSIRGSSGPTWIVVGNLLKGTTQEDIHETLQQFGAIEDIIQRKPPTDNYPSIAFEIAFTSRSAAGSAIERLDGALADGRLLQVTYRDAAKFAASTEPQPSLKPRPQTPPVMVAPQRELMPTIPSGPRMQQQQQQQPPHKQTVQQQQTQQSNNRNGRELLSTNQQQKKAVPAPSLQSRLMTAAELKTLRKQQARAAPVVRLMPGVPKGPKGTVATPATTAAVPLAKRITLPLAMRLSAEAKMNGPASSLESIGASKKRKARAKGKAKNATGMDID